MIQAKNLKVTLLFVDFSKAFDSMYSGKMKQIQLAYDLSKENHAIVCSPNEDTNFFDVVIGIFQGDTLISYFFMLCLDYILQTSIDLIKENGFTLIQARSSQYPAETMTDVEYTDDLVLLTNIPAESLLHSLEQTVGGAMNANAIKTMF